MLKPKADAYTEDGNHPHLPLYCFTKIAKNYYECNLSINYPGFQIWKPNINFVFT